MNTSTQARQRFNTLLQQFYVKERKDATAAKKATFAALSQDEIFLLLEPAMDTQIDWLSRQAREAVAGNSFAVPAPTIRNQVAGQITATRRESVKASDEAWRSARAMGGNLNKLMHSLAAGLVDMIYIPSLNSGNGDWIQAGKATFDQLEEAKKYLLHKIDSQDKTVRYFERLQEIIVKVKDRIDEPTGFAALEYIQKHGDGTEAELETASA